MLALRLHGCRRLRPLRTVTVCVGPSRHPPRLLRRRSIHAGHQVPVSEAQPGDLLFYATDRRNRASIHHVTVFVGRSEMTEAPESGQSVTETAVRRNEELMQMAVEHASVRR